MSTASPQAHLVTNENGEGDTEGSGVPRRPSNLPPHGPLDEAVVAYPTNSFGEIEFSGLNQTAKFVRLDAETNTTNIQQILAKKWDLGRPTLIINIFGGDFEKKRQLKMIFKKGLWKAAESAGCWIVTSGFNYGIMKLTGEAVRDYTDAYGGNHMIAMGVCSWGCVSRNEVLVSQTYEGQNPAIYVCETEDILEAEDIRPSDEQQSSLDPNHLHFFLVDNGIALKKGQESQFRTRFEHTISSWQDEDNEEIKIPMCGLLIGGDRFALRQVFLAMTENRCPIVALKGTTGAADVLASAFEHIFGGEDTSYKDTKKKDDHDEDEDEETVFYNKMTKVCQDYFGDMDYTDYSKEIEMLNVLLKEGYLQLIEIFDMEDDYDMDGKMISSLLSSAGTDVSVDQLNLKQLKICLTLNRADIARDKIFLENKKWKKGDLNDYMYQALMEDRHDFVKLFLEQGFSLEEFCTVHIIERLYSDQLKRMNSKVAIFHQLWEYHRSHRDKSKSDKNNKKVRLKEVGKVIRVLVGDFYHPLYLSKDFQNKLMGIPSSTNGGGSHHGTTKALIETAQTGYLPAYLFTKQQDKANKIAAQVAEQPNQVALPLANSTGNHVPAADREAGFDPANSYKRHRKLRKGAAPTKSIPDMEICDYERSPINFANRDDEDGTSNQKHGYENPMMSHYQPDGTSPQMKSKDGDHSAAVVPHQMPNDETRRHTCCHIEESRAKQITLDRPARELMLWALLVGKLQMAELFWTMEKEPIAGALLSSMILNAMVSKTDDFTDKEDFKNFSKHFEDQAEGVLNQCYREDERRAQLLINRDLTFYGNSSCIYLAAEGESIKFMAHPCCQDFLTSTWMGKLSPKNAMGRFSFGILCGLLCPFLLPKVMLYRLTEEEAAKLQLSQQKQDQTVSVATPDQVTLEMGELGPDGAQFYPGQENLYEQIDDNHRDSNNSSAVARPQQQQNQQQQLDMQVHQNFFSNTNSNSNQMINKPDVKSSEKLTFKQMLQRIKDFYMAPVIRFVYNTISYLTFLFIFSYLLLFQFEHNINPIEFVVIIWMVTLLLEEIKQATLNGISFSTYISDSWNKLDCIAVGLFVIGFILRLTSNLQERATPVEGNIFHEYNVILTDDLFIIARICYAFSLFAFYIRLMYIFSFHIALGPKLIMIGKMVINDLIPFMVILLVFILGYGVAAQSIAYPIGLYTPNTEFNSSMPEKMDQKAIFVNFLTTAYYQMFGDFKLDLIRGEDDGCKKNGECPHWTATWLVPIMLSIYVLLTNILMFNLLIAMFSRTYENVEKESVYHWNYQRYTMISEYIERSPLAPPLIIFWHFYELILYITLKCEGKSMADLEDPLKISYKNNRKKERELTKWEHMKAMDFLRDDQEQRQKKGGRGDSKSIIVRSTGGGGQQQSMFSNAADISKQMTDATSGLGLELEKKFKNVDTQLLKINADVESRLQAQGQLLDKLMGMMATLQDNQAKLAQKLTETPTDPIPAEIQNLDERIRLVVNSVYESRPSWFEEASKQAAEQALKSTPVAVRELGSPLLERIRPVQQVVEEPKPEPVRPPTPEESSDSEHEADDASIRPAVDDPTTGRIIQHHGLDHRLWRYTPFNFEHYPGMRMNVPPDRIPWEIEYRDYFAYDTSDEVLVFPTEICHDNPNVPVQSIAYNQYDTTFHVRRQSMIGRYRLDSTSGAPLNPMGRTGLKGKGLLPHWGPNHAVVIILTRWARAPSGAIIHRLGHPILQVVSLFRHKQYCLPWFLGDHLPNCDYDECVPQIIKTFISKRLKQLMQRHAGKQEINAVQKGRSEQIFKGYLDDHLNADNAWIEAVVINIHESEDWKFSDAMLKVFAEPDSDEQIKWMEVAYSTALRSSHCELLKTVAGNQNAYF